MGGDKFTLLTVDEDVLYGKGKEGSSRFIVIRKRFKIIELQDFGYYFDNGGTSK